MLAAGGPHVVDDAGIVAPGHCELESYGNVGPDGAWRFVVSPTCAFRALGNFEIGLIAAAEGPPGIHVIPGVAVKTGLGHIDLGVSRSVAFAAEISAGFDPESNQLDTISTNIPISVHLVSWLELHGNVGLDFEPRNAGIPTYGLAALVEPVAGWQLVGEVAGRRGFSTRTQWGVRRSTDAFDFDVMYSRSIDDSTRGNWLTFGVTRRFGHRW